MTTRFLLINPLKPHLVLAVEAVADTRSDHLYIPERVRAKLQLKVVAYKPVIRADGSIRDMPYAGPIELRFKDRVGFAGALIRGSEVSIGAIPMDDMGLVVIRQTHGVDIDPMPRWIVKQARPANITYLVRNSEVAQ